MSKSLPVLQNSPSPDEPGMNLPTLHESALDWEELDCVLADLDDFAVIEDIACRSATGEETKLSDLVLARDRFVAGDYHGLQVHYEFADTLWVDTFLREATGARLVRMSEQELQESLAEHQEQGHSCGSASC